MDVEVVHHQVDGAGLGIRQRQLREHYSELQTRAIGRCKSEVTSGPRFYGAKDGGSSTAFVFTFTARFTAWLHRGDGPDFGMQCDRLLIQANDWFGWIE